MHHKIEKESILKKCQNCGANMYYSINKEGLFCKNCQTLNKVEDTYLNQKQSVEVGKQKDLERQNEENEVFFKCENCGADITLKKYEISSKCPYCDSANVAQTYEIKGLKPDKVLKFEIDKEDVKSKFEDYVKKKFFIPRPFKKNIPERDIEALYFPSFCFDASTNTTYSGTLYKIERDDEGSRKRYFLVRGTINNNFKDIVVEDSSRISQILLNKLFPFNLEKSVDYKPEYLLGFHVERHSSTFQTSLNNSYQIIKKNIEQNIVKKHNADGVSKLDTKINYISHLYQYTILPLYVLDYHYNNKHYKAFMNGQTGKIGGKFPISPIKVTFVSISVVLFVVMIIVLLNLGG